VSVSNFPASQAVTGTFWQATQPVSIATMPSTPVTGTFWQATQPVSIAGTVTTAPGSAGTPFNCAISSTATASTVVTGCGAPGANLRRYITDIEYASSIIATTTNFMTLQYGTGSACATGTTVVWRMYNSVAFLPVLASIETPIALGVNTDLCFLHPGAGTRVVNVRGYIAP
jgi:hypothetical protein